MLEKDSYGNIIGTLPPTAKKVPGMELLITMKDGDLTEYSPEAFNSVNKFFIEKYQRAYVDNLCDAEWTEEKRFSHVIEVDGICKVAVDEGAEKLANEIIDVLKKYVKPAEHGEYKNHIENCTTLSAYYLREGKYVSVELPYCTIAQIYKLGDNYGR